MIIDLQKFVATERPHWTELERQLHTLEAEPNHTMSLDQLRRFHNLYERTSADLAPAISAQACEALLLLATRQESLLNNLVGRCIELPAGVHEIEENGRPRLDDPTTRVVSQARWVAQQILDLGLTSLAICPAATEVELDLASLNWLNEQLPKIREAARTYAADLAWDRE